MDPILVASGTGALGRHVVRRLNSAVYDVRVLTRQSRNDERAVHFTPGDLLSGVGVDAAVAGVSRRDAALTRAR
jgi:nucleoside-diphosphate-sugar epimerase